MLKTIGIIVFLFLPLLTFAQGNYTKVDGSILYSRYYPNVNSKFKGTIVFQNGAGTSLKEWTKNKIFFQCIKQNGSVFLYDRSGLGKSPPDFSMSLKRPMTARLINSKLIKLLEKRHIKPPYILISHSYGGIYAGYFARKYPNLVAGMLMIDPVPSNYQWANWFLKQYKSDISKMDKLSSRRAYKLYSFARANKYNTISAQLFYQLKGFKDTKQEISALLKMSNQIPIIIISSSYMNKNAPIKGNWYQLQKQWLNKNPNSKILKIYSGHFIQLEHPRFVYKQLKKIVKLIVRNKNSINERVNRKF